MANASTDEQADAMVVHWLTNKTRFCINANYKTENLDECYYGLPSISADDPTFPPLGYWRGSVSFISPLLPRMCVYTRACVHVCVCARVAYVRFTIHAEHTLKRRQSTLRRRTLKVCLGAYGAADILVIARVRPRTVCSSSKESHVYADDRHVFKPMVCSASTLAKAVLLGCRPLVDVCDWRLFMTNLLFIFICIEFVPRTICTYIYKLTVYFILSRPPSQLKLPTTKGGCTPMFARILIRTRMARWLMVKCGQMTALVQNSTTGVRWQE